MDRDPSKRITGFASGLGNGKQRLVLIVNHNEELVIVSEALTNEQLEILGSGYHDGLTIAAVLSEGEIRSFIDDPDAMDAMNIPLDAGESEKELFKSGAIGGLKLVLKGYWLDERSAH